MSTSDEHVDLGFAESTETWKLSSRFFPSKIGGKPAWLDLSNNIPKCSDLNCSYCLEVLSFLCQVYAPIDSNIDCFHRTIYIFMCKNEKCCKSNSTLNMKAIRCQLRRNNKFFPFDPPVIEETWRKELNTESFGIHLCEVCGIKTDNCCAKCKCVYYCCKQHQLFDWRYGHKMSCENSKDRSRLKLINNLDGSSNKLDILFPEYELIIETENIGTDEDPLDQTEENTEEIEMQKYLKLVEDGKAGTLPDTASVEKELSRFAFKDDDETFTEFKERIKHYPDQVLRYDRGGTPLWMSELFQAKPDDIPDCTYCKGKRIFEFQIQPQMLNILKLDTSNTSIDWGVLVVYTCENSCGGDPAYKEEYIYKQDLITE